MTTPDEKGNTLLQHLEKAEAKRVSLGLKNFERDSRLDGVQFHVPEDYQLYGYGMLALFRELGTGRQMGFNGVEAFSWSDFHGWTQETGYVLTPYEVTTIKAMDVAYVNTVRRLQSER